MGFSKILFEGKWKRKDQDERLVSLFSLPPSLSFSLSFFHLPTFLLLHLLPNISSFLMFIFAIMCNLPFHKMCPTGHVQIFQVFCPTGHVRFWWYVCGLPAISGCCFCNRKPTVGWDGGWIDSACVVFGSFFLYMYPKGGGRKAACLSVLSHIGCPLI